MPGVRDAGTPMATADHDSSLDLDVAGRGPGAADSADGSSRGPQIWLDGEVLACACPDCGAPMSIRLWLLVADCWRCGASIELTDEQEREAMRLLREHEASRRAETREAAAAITPTMRPVSKAPPLPRTEAPAPSARTAPRPQEPTKSVEAAPAARPVPAAAPPRRRAAAQVPRGARARLRDVQEKGEVGVLLGDFFKDLPAWLVSLVVHLVAMLLLGLWVATPPNKTESITLATSVDYSDIAGDTDLIEEVDLDAFEFDDPGAPVEDEMAPSETLGQLDSTFETDTVLPSDPAGMLEELTELTRVLPTVSGGSLFAGRDPRVRDHLVRTQGGTSQTEAAVARGLMWLARHQNADGSWSLDAWHRAPRATGGSEGLGGHSDTAATAMALLPFLGAGQTHLGGEYRDEVAKGLRWLVYKQRQDGDLRGPGIGRMYAHGQAAIVLSEAYAMTADEGLRAPAQLALDFIVQAQHHAGGWRYQPGEAGDTSVVGWQLMALRSGKMGYLHVPDKVFALSERYLDAAGVDRYRGTYSYQPGGGADHVMTAEALLCRQYLGWPREHHALQNGVHWLLDSYPPDKRSPNIYYWYYATQVMHHMGGDVWKRWNTLMRSVLVEMQETRGPMAGSWNPVGDHAGRGGRIYMTALAICTLEVYYRHLPMYQSDIVREYTPNQSGAGSDELEMETSK